MTVGELIRRLSEFPSGAAVWTDGEVGPVGTVQYAPWADAEAEGLTVEISGDGE